jgi:penicillin-binding protein 1A
MLWTKMAAGVGFALVLCGSCFLYVTPSIGQFEQAYQSLAVHVEAGPDGVPVVDASASLKIPLDDVPMHFRDALVTMEDRRFGEHAGVDWRGLGRALVAGLPRGRHEGGSTITQQLARTVFLSTERSPSRKVREMVLALKLERHYAKDEILAMYVNRVPIRCVTVKRRRRRSFSPPPPGGRAGVGGNPS